MRDARLDHDWERTGEICSLLYNAHRAGGGARTSEDFNRLKLRRKAERQRRIPEPKIGMAEALKMWGLSKEEEKRG